MLEGISENIISSPPVSLGRPGLEARSALMYFSVLCEGSWESCPKKKDILEGSQQSISRISMCICGSVDSLLHFLVCFPFQTSVSYLRATGYLPRIKCQGNKDPSQHPLFLLKNSQGPKVHKGYIYVSVCVYVSLCVCSLKQQLLWGAQDDMHIQGQVILVSLQHRYGPVTQTALRKDQAGICVNYFLDLPAVSRRIGCHVVRACA